LNTLLYFAVLYLVFSVFMRFNIEHYKAYLLLGIVLWSYFAEATLAGMNAFLAKSSLISKVNFPKEVIIYASILTSSFTLMINLIVFFILSLFSSLEYSFALFLLPVFIIMLFFLVLGMIFLLSTLYMKFRDVAHIWNVFLQLGFWLTPVVYAMTMIPGRFQKFFLLNPMATIINSARDCVVYGKVPEVFPIFIASVIILVIFVMGYLLFKKSSKYFAEEL